MPSDDNWGKNILVAQPNSDPAKILKIPFQLKSIIVAGRAE